VLCIRSCVARVGGPNRPNTRLFRPELADRPLGAGGAEAFRRDNSNCEVHIYDTGHFALETHAHEIAAAIRDFIGRQASKQVSASGALVPHDDRVKIKLF
jgi:hypothetical protein